MARTRVVGIGALVAVLFLGSGQAMAHDDWNERDDDRRADISGSVSVEMEGLDAYGEWVWDNDRGRGWRPHVEHDWRPFWRGHWAWRDQWVWVSADPWGDMPSHYGEWIWSSRYGWVWIPGTEWAPARVVWIVSGPVIAWAPIGIDISIGNDARFWSYADAGAFYRPIVRPHRIPPPAIHLHGRARHDIARVIVPEPRAPRRELQITTPREPIRPSHESRRVIRPRMSEIPPSPLLQRGANGALGSDTPRSRSRDHKMSRGFERRELR